MATWVTSGEVATIYGELWPDFALLIQDGTVGELILEAAQEQCAEYAPPLADGVAVPARYKVALVMQARAVHRSLLAGSGDQIGADGMTVTVYPMDRTVKGLLRPRRGVPGVK